MTVKRLREMPDADELSRFYAVPHDHTRWADHRIRVDMTATLAASLVPPRAAIVDLSCGDGEIAMRLAAISNGDVVLGDLAPGYPLTGPIEDTAPQVAASIEFVKGVGARADLWVLCETLEHLDDPGAVLALIRPLARTLVFSTPVDAFDDTNLEHVWAWDRDGVTELLEAGGWTIDIVNILDLRPSGFIYSYMIGLAS
jgi:2-polyprenyl-3-methyl-5-hydroxy-6-metoxy-1,4-benzoquinol methylase